MLLNLSNHPSGKWPDNQRAMAIAHYGRIEDMDFPSIDPEATETDIEALVDLYLARILQQGPSAVHLMGEMTFCFSLVRKLQQHQIPCIASTTQRITVEQDNTKTSRFEFVKFRAYDTHTASNGGPIQN
jgi:hypothetical protein